MSKGKIRFTRADPRRCPAYRDYCIQDRAIGADVYGHEAYQYALFRKCPFQLLRRFRTRKQAYAYQSNLTGLDRMDIKWGSCRIVANDRDMLGVLDRGKMYRLNKRTREIHVRPEDDKQITGWFDTYKECLETAKTAVQREEEKI